MLIYDPIVDSWAPTAAAPIGAGWPMCPLPSGRVLFVGIDCEDLSNRSAIYDPVSDTWQPAAPILDSTWSTADTCVGLSDGRVMIAGGVDGMLPGRQVETYSETTDAWTMLEPLLQAHSEPLLTTLTSGDVLAAGWSQTEMYEPGAGTWSMVGAYAPPCDYSYPSLTTLDNDTALIVAGIDVSGASALFDDTTARWRTVAPLPDGERFAQTAVRLSDDSVLVLGGFFPYTGGPPCSEQEGCPATTNWRFYLQ
jgi:hypothetical protein